jgi:NTP pyrophosphatase (non-canonical NTP hydrolase)
MTTISELQAIAYKQSADKGFHDNEPVDPWGVLAMNSQRIALIHSELSEALEELRRVGHSVSRNHYTLPGVPGEYPSVQAAKSTHHGPGVNPKPEGVPSEMADVVIRVLDFCEANDIDLEAALIEKLAYNATRAHKHGGKSF